MTETLAYVDAGDFEGLTEFLLKRIENLRLAGADFAAMACNTTHIVREELKKRSTIPFLDIVDETCAYAEKAGVRKVVIFGTMFTMSNGFYEKAFAGRGIQAVVPDIEDRKTIAGIIFPNLENGIVLAEDKKRILALAKRALRENGADALVLGCTELPLIIKEGDLDTVLIDTARVHVRAILRELLA